MANPQQAPPGPPVNPKLKQFLEEITELSDKYQYVLTPYLQVNERGITPALKVMDKIPPKTPPKPAESEKPAPPTESKTPEKPIPKKKK